MKLLLTWLLCVPVVVAAMVLPRAMSPAGLRMPAESGIASASCIRQGDLHQVPPSIAQDRDAVACRRTVQ